ncbi:hypothetical protein JCM11641_006451 [Rhodosporidiobolus odoratus]
MPFRAPVFPPPLSKKRSNTTLRPARRTSWMVDCSDGNGRWGKVSTDEREALAELVANVPSGPHSSSVTTLLSVVRMDPLVQPYMEVARTESLVRTKPTDRCRATSVHEAGPLRPVPSALTTRQGSSLWKRENGKWVRANSGPPANSSAYATTEMPSFRPTPAHPAVATSKSVLESFVSRPFPSQSRTSPYDTISSSTSTSTLCLRSTTRSVFGHDASSPAPAPAPSSFTSLGDSAGASSFPFPAVAPVATGFSVSASFTSLPTVSWSLRSVEREGGQERSTPRPRGQRFLSVLKGLRASGIWETQES